jgi:hypothetical protein
MAYFETRGFSEIAPSGPNHVNWIYSMVFPRLLHLLSPAPTSVPATASSSTSSSLLSLRPSSTPPRHAAVDLMRGYAYHSILQLSYVHRSNMKLDGAQALEMVAQAETHRKKAQNIALKMRVQHPVHVWQTEDYQ